MKKFISNPFKFLSIPLYAMGIYTLITNWRINMRNLLKQALLSIPLILMTSSLHAMEAYGWIANSQNQFYKKKNAEKTKENGTENFDQLPNKKTDIELKCGQALYLYGGHTALKEAFNQMKKAVVITTDCTNPDKLGVFFSKVGASGKTKIIIMITPVDSTHTQTIGEEYLYQFMVGEEIDKKLVEWLNKKQILGVIDAIR